MRIRLYQVDPSLDRDGLRFLPYAQTVEKAGQPDPSRYCKVFDGDVQTSDLEVVFRLFNTDFPDGYNGRAMSVSDVAVVDETVPGTPAGAYFCDLFGYRLLQSFDESKAKLQPSGLRMLVLEPGLPPYVSRIRDSLESLQAAVGGYIECTYPFEDNAFVIGNEEAKLIGMEGNRRINGAIYAGPLLIAGDDGAGGTVDLTDEQIRLYGERFRDPEFIPREEVEADTGLTFYPFG
ncbi:MAG: DUF3846 domain-containing protein [Clostridia bacterium]|nr:DUF3846 domain-containing protein [Clostridia bacterium]